VLMSFNSKQKLEIKELELTLFCTGKFRSRKEARKSAIEKYKLQIANQEKANEKAKETKDYFN